MAIKGLSAGLRSTLSTPGRRRMDDACSIGVHGERGADMKAGGRRPAEMGWVDRVH